MGRRQCTFRALQVTEYNLGESIAGAVRMLLSAELLLHAVLDMLSRQFAGWIVDDQSYRTMQCLLVITIVLFGILAPLCGKYRVLACAGFEVGFLSLGGWYGWRHLEQFEKGIFGLCGDYLVAWNAYYKTNYIVEYDRAEMSRTLGFLVLVFVLVFLILRYVTGVRWLMLIPPLGVLALGLFVDRLAGWEGLACFFVGTLALYSGPGERAKTLFAPVNYKKSNYRSVLTYFLSIGLAAAEALAIVAVSGTLFAGLAGKIPEKTQGFMAFQNRLENRIQNLANRIQLPSGGEHLDNSTPRYTGEVVLTISADRVPLSNLYLPEFYSGTYRNGSWKQEKKKYRRMAADSGLDGDHLGTLLRQAGYEYLSTVPHLVFSYNANAEPEWVRHYTINYGDRRTTSAYIPYFADLSSLQDEVWVEDEGLVKKRRSADELSFDGWAGNTDILNMDILGETAGSKDAMDWYSGYVEEHYLGGSKLSAVKEYAQEERQWLDAYGFSMAYNDDSAEDVRMTNLYRLIMADEVRNQLAAHADYNLYLSDIPAGTDTVQYFLETGHEGYCMHFASAGTLILQELGIPARYASGYIVKRDAFREIFHEGALAKVYDRNAHAWVEIYMENIGWVPVEMTPGYETEESELPTDLGKQDELQQRHEERLRQEDSQAKTPRKELQRPEETQEPRSEEHETERKTQEPAGSGAGNGSGTGFPWELLARIAGLGVLVLAVLCAAVFAVRLGIRRYRQALWEEIQRKQNRRAVMRINRRIYRRLQGGGIRSTGHIRFAGHGSGRAGIQWLGITDAEYERKLARAYPSILLRDWTEYMRIVKKAAFSEEAILPQELTFCYQIYQTHRKKR